ncbi:oligopeptide/dipeptide ABC transporter ATP-binding protein [Leptospira interrogans]
MHPYSKALFAAAPVPDRRADAVRSLPEPAIKGEVPSPINLPSGCRFHPRCPLCQSICQASVPKLEIVNSRDIRCHFAVELAT